uniref:UBX domain-containing protein 11 n=1 Tax=Nothobranchius korthausae TaxID=1143690 RepID=A0A1A8H6G0_9TELE
MSSPSSMLRKTRRAPRQSSVNEQGVQQKVPFKRNLLKEIHAELTADESRAPPSNFELMAAMMHRITLLEKTVESQEEEIRNEEKLMSALEKRLRTQKGAGTFMHHHRLVLSVLFYTPPARSFNMNFDLVLQKMQDLNVLTGEGQCFIHKTAKLSKKDPVPLKLYRNDIEMFDGPFRSFQEQSTQRCMQDLVDGCFPSELQQRFPDGVPFEDEPFTRRKMKNLQMQSAFSHQEEADHRSVPEKAAKDGGQSRCGDRHQEFSEGDCRGQTLSCKRTSPKAVITLKVKSEDEDQTFVVKMWLSETVGHLRSYLDQHREPNGSGYDIISMHPPRVYSDDDMMIQSCGLSANSTVLLRRRKLTGLQR